MIDEQQAIGPDSEFSLLVKRELRNQATPEEIEYLKKHIEEWRTDLVLRLKRAEGHITKIQNDMEQMQSRCFLVGKEATAQIWFKYKAEQDEKLAKTRGFIHTAQSKIAELNLYKHKVQKEVQKDEIQLEKRRKNAYCNGYGDAIFYFTKLLEDGYTGEQAHLLCISYWSISLNSWSRSAETWNEKPIPPQMKQSETTDA
jgi:hypothetical protein